MCLTRLCFGEILLPSSGPSLDKMGEFSGIVAFLNAFVHDVINLLYVQDLVLASKIKMKKKMGIKKININKCKEFLSKGLSTNLFHHT